MARITNSQKRWLKRGSDPNKVERLKRRKKIVGACMYLFALLVVIPTPAAMIVCMIEDIKSVSTLAVLGTILLSLTSARFWWTCVKYVVRL